VKISPSLKYQSETENESSVSRSRLRRDRGRRRSASPTKKSAQKASQTGRELISLPPKAPSPPLAIVQATCGPVHADVTFPERSSTVPVAISPAGPDQTFNVHARVAASKRPSVTRLDLG